MIGVINNVNIFEFTTRPELAKSLTGFCREDFLIIVDNRYILRGVVIEDDIYHDTTQEDEYYKVIPVSEKEAVNLSHSDRNTELLEDFVDNKEYCTFRYKSQRFPKPL